MVVLFFNAPFSAKAKDPTCERAKTRVEAAEEPEGTSERAPKDKDKATVGAKAHAKGLGL